MKPALALSLFLVCCGVLLGDSTTRSSLSGKPAPLLEDLVRMTQAGSSDVTVLAYAKAHRLELPPEMSDRDLRWLRDSGVSELVVRYMSAIDVRPSGGSAREDAVYRSDEYAARPPADYSNSESDYGNYGGYPDRYASNYANNYADTYYDASPGYDYYPYYYPYYDYYPYYGYGYYPYPLFFVDRFGHHHGHHGGSHGHHDGHHDGHHGFDRGHGSHGHHGEFVGHGGSRDAWRERGFSGRRGGSVVAGARQPGRPALARGGSGGGFGAPHGRVVGSRGSGPSVSARGSHPGFSGGPRSGGSFGRGSRMATGSVGGRGRR